jgi:site-specific recombinase XerD
LTRPPKRTNTVPITLTEAEVAILLHSTTNLREKALISTMAYSGIRNNELCNLRIRDIDIPNGILRMEECKFNKQRDAAVTGECLGLLEEYLSWRKTQAIAKGKPVMPDDLLFVTKRHGHQLQSQDVRKIVRVLAKRAGIERRVWPHLMRHSLATNMANRGAHMLTIKDQLGHVYVQSTMIYVHRSQHAHTADYRQHAPSYL